MLEILRKEELFEKNLRIREIFDFGISYYFYPNIAIWLLPGKNEKVRTK